MTTRPQLSLGWPFPSGLPYGPDWEFLRRIFGDLAKTLSWPLCSGTFTGPAALNINPINFTPTAGFDSSSLYRPATDRIYCPQDFNQYMAVGVCGATWVTVATNRTNLIWNKNTINTVWAQTEYSDAATVRMSVPLFEQMNKGDFLTVSTASSGAGTDLTTAKFVVMFIPLR